MLALLVASLGLAGCEQCGRRLPEKVLARVNEEEISVDAFERELKDVILEPVGEGKASSLHDLKRAYLEQMIERKILAQEARRLGLKISPEEVNQALSDIKKDYPSKRFDERLSLGGVTLEEWKSRLEEQLLAEKMVRSALQYHGEVSEKEALQYYEDHLFRYRQPPKVRARQIVVADGEEAIQILKHLKRGDRFEKWAMEKSLGPEKENGGDLGYFSQGEKPAEFDRVFSLQVGGLSEVIKSPYGYHIFKLDERVEAREIPFEEAKARILWELKEKKAEEEYQRWFTELRKKTRIKVNSKRL